MDNKYQKTIYACFLGYIVQAIVNNFVPLLFLTFESAYNIPLSKITLLITFNFGIQLLVDLLSAGLDRKSTRLNSVTRIVGAFRTARNITGCLHRTFNICYNLRLGRWTARGISQPDCGKLP